MLGAGAGAGGRADVRGSAAATSASRSWATASASARASSSGARSAAQRARSSGTARPRLADTERALEPLEALAQLAVLLLELTAIAVAVVVAGADALERRIALPPVDAHLARLVDRRDEQAQLDREQLDVEQVDLDVARDHDALVEHPFEDVGEVRRRIRSARQRVAGRALQAPLLRAHAESTCPRK